MELQKCPDRQWWHENFTASPLKPLAGHIQTTRQQILTQYDEDIF